MYGKILAVYQWSSALYGDLYQHGEPKSNQCSYCKVVGSLESKFHLVGLGKCLHNLETIEIVETVLRSLCQRWMLILKMVSVVLI